MTPGMPAPSGYNLPYGVSLRDLEPPEPCCERCGDPLTEEEQEQHTNSATRWLCDLCMTDRKERGQE